MGLIKRADIEQYTRDSYVMDLGDLESRGKAVVAAANAEAESILNMAKAKRKQLLATAEKDGYDKGHRDGYEQGYIDGVVNGVEDARRDHSEILKQLEDVWTTQLNDFESKRDQMLNQARTQVVELAAKLAQRVVHRVVELDPTIVVKQMEAVLSTITEPSRLVISVNPDDIQIMQHSMSQLLERFATCEHAQVVSDPTLPKGSVVASTPTGGIIDASINTQLERVLDAILPDDHSMETLGSIQPRAADVRNTELDSSSQELAELDESEASDEAPPSDEKEDAA